MSKTKETGVSVVVVEGSSLAFGPPSAMFLLVGVKCIAQMDGDWAPGVVLEPPKMRNNYRYLVFFDQHHSRYVLHQNVRVLVGNPEFPEDSRSFLERYINEYPEIPLARLSIGKSLKIQSGKKWLIAEVVEVDASLAPRRVKVDENPFVAGDGCFKVEAVQVQNCVGGCDEVRLRNH